MFKQPRRIQLVLLVALLILGSIGAIRLVQSQANPGLHVVGNHIVGSNGATISFRGVAADSLEYHCQGDGHFNTADFAAMRTWDTNIIRVPLSAPFWLNAHGICPNYHQTVQLIVQRAEAAGFYVLLSLFYISPFDGQGDAAGGGYPMPDARETPDFWRSLGSAYAHDPRVLFEAYSEPHEWDNMSDQAVWTIWRDGGTVHNDLSDNGRVIGEYQSVGMQQLVNIINGAAPNNIVLINGMQWGGDLSYVTKGFALHGANLAYSLHLYPGTRSQDPAQWPGLFANLAQQVPVLATEFGQIDCGTAYVQTSMPYLAAHTTGLIAWVWDTGTCQRPALLLDWTGKPSPYGQPIHDFFTGTKSTATTNSPENTGLKLPHIAVDVMRRQRIYPRVVVEEGTEER